MKSGHFIPSAISGIVALGSSFVVGGTMGRVQDRVSVSGDAKAGVTLPTRGVLT